MERQLGIGVIGLGWMGRVHTSSYRRVLEHFPDLGVTPRLVVAADLSETRRAHAERVGFERTVADWRAVLERPAVEVVSVTLPNAMHREVAVAAAEAGKHLWVEKPVGPRARGHRGRGRRRPPRGRDQRRRLLLPLRARRRARPRADRRRARSATSRITAASSSPTTPTGRTRPPRGASSAPTRARARSAT